MGGKFHLKLNTGKRPIANKYREGKMKRTLKREFKELEIVKREAIETGSAPAGISSPPQGEAAVYRSGKSECVRAAKGRPGGGRQLRLLFNSGCGCIAARTEAV